MNTNKKEYFMNKFKKVGLTALAGSLVAVSAQAGELTVTGGANITLKSGTAASTNNVSCRGIGTDKDVAFKGTGELDNGTTFTVFTATNDSQTNLTSGYISIATPSFGSFTLGQSNGSASYMYDEEVPQAYEQVSDAKQTMANQIGNFMDNNHIMYTPPALELMGATFQAHLGYTPQAGDSVVGDGGQVTYSETWGEGKEAGLTISYDALKLGFYGAERENVTGGKAATGQQLSDEFNGAWYVKYSMGPVSIGYSETYMDGGVTQALTSEKTTSSKAERTAGGIFTGEQMSIAFNVNDNMSISYTSSDETYDTQDDAKTAVTTDDDVTETIDAIQVAYSMGGMSIKAYNMEVSNPDQDDDAADQSITEIALGFAF